MSSMGQYVFSVTIFRPSRHLQDAFKTSWKGILNLSCKDTLETSLTHLARRLEDVFKMSWKTETCYAEDVFKTSWRRTKCLLGISVSNKSKSVSNKSISHKSISAYLRRIENALSRTQSFRCSSYFDTQAVFLS